MTDRDPIMGHCNYKDIEDHRRWAEKSDEKFDEGEASIHRAVVNYLKSIYKDIKWIIGLHQTFWDKLKNVDKVVIIGWSAGTADLPYLRKISESISKNTKWYAYCYDNKAYKVLNAAMIEEDIEGKFEVNYISTAEIASITANIDTLKADLKAKKTALKKTEKEVATLKAKKEKADAKAAEEAKKAEAEAVLKKLLVSGMSTDEILAKLK